VKPSAAPPGVITVRRTGSTDAALVVRQDTPAAFLGTLALGLDWH
jgi:hypothetical protein